MNSPNRLPRACIPALLALALLCFLPLLASSQTAPATPLPAPRAPKAASAHTTAPSSPAPSTPPAAHKRRLSWGKTLLLTAAAAGLTALIVYEKTKPKYPPNCHFFNFCGGGGPQP